MTASRSAIAFETFGARIGIETFETIPADFRPALPPGARLTDGKDCDATYTIRTSPPASDDEGERYELLLDGDSLGTSRHLPLIQLQLESDLHFQVALHARDFLFVHAGVVEWEGRATVLPGVSRSGKSSLVMALVRAGARYRSDEYAVLDRSGLVHAYPKPLAERREDQLPLLHAAAELGAEPDAAPIPIGRVVVSRFHAGAAWNPARISKAQTMMALFANTVVARTQAEFALSVLSAAVAGAEGLDGDRGEAAEMAARLLDAKRPPRARARGGR